MYLPKYNAQLYIPRGSIPEGRRERVYIYVDPTASFHGDVNPPQVALSSVIQCGPPGLKFERSTVLSFSHQASKDNINWTLRAQVCENYGTAKKTWQTLKDDVAFFTSEEVEILVDHFCGHEVVGDPPGDIDIRNVGLFGGTFGQGDSNHPFRIHIWKNDPEATKVGL